ncbi:MAG TPA: ComEA family DNA-binding protein, partial [Solirubrobacterales bacterium]|nr:ComEA family DNA-binding protein [Solirubrobacterales bacterium]
LLVGARAIRSAGEGTPFEPIPPSSSGGGLPGEVTVASGGSDLVVDVAGAVQDPGVYRLPAGARVVDALARAGGASNGAMLEAINRAARLVDGQQVVVPRRVPGGSPTATGAGPEAGPISLGAATVEQLEEIDGIGPVTAQKIVEYRDGRGGLASVDQLDEVSGIGPATMESLRARLQP